MRGEPPEVRPNRPVDNLRKVEIMNIRKIAAAAALTAGAAMTFAPLASAVPDPVTPAILESEIASLNSLFVSEATLAGIPSTDYAPVAGFDTILPAHVLIDAPQAGTPSLLDYELYGLNPIVAGVSSDSGSFNVLNGALVEFYDAYNTELWSLANPAAPIDTIPLTDLFGSSTGIAEALATGTGALAVTDFLTDGWNDLLGYFGVFGM